MKTEPPRAPKSAADVNRDYYGTVDAGRDDYWRKMAAPRFRLRTVIEALKKLGPTAVVDLGCGNGAALDEVSRHLPAAQLAGVDLSPAQIEANSVREPSIRWQCADLDGEVTFADDFIGAFDAVTALEVIEHLDHPTDFLANARSLAKPAGGYLVLSTQSGKLRETERRVGHRQHFAVPEMNTLLRDCGWRPIQIWNAGYPFHDLSKWYANLNPDASMKRFGEDAYGWSEDLICAALRIAFSLNSRRRGAQLFAIAARE